MVPILQMRSVLAIGTAHLPFCSCPTLKLELPLGCCSVLSLGEDSCWSLPHAMDCAGVKACSGEHMCPLSPFWKLVLLLIILHVISRIMFQLSFIFRIGLQTPCFITMNDFHSNTLKQGFSTSTLLTFWGQITLQPCALWDVYLATSLDFTF